MEAKRIYELKYKLLNKTGLISCRPIVLMALCLLFFIVILVLSMNAFELKPSYAEFKPCTRSHDEVEETQKCAANIEKMDVEKADVGGTAVVQQDVTIAVSICDGQFSQAVAMLKSAILFSKDVNLYIHMFVVKEVMPLVVSEVSRLEAGAVAIGVLVNYRVHNAIWAPNGNEKWYQNFAVCSSERLFLATRLPNTDAVLYVGADILFLSSLKEYWKHFKCMDDRQLIGVSMETTEYEVNTPFYGETGLNADVMLMNLTRLRQMDFENSLIFIADRYQDCHLSQPQQLLNVFFHYHPCYVYEMSCTFNCDFEQLSCRENNDGCKEGEQNGVALLNGRSSSSNQARLASDVVIEFEKFDLRTGNPRNLVHNLKIRFLYHSDSDSCLKDDADLKILTRIRRYLDFHFMETNSSKKQ